MSDWQEVSEAPPSKLSDTGSGWPIGEPVLLYGPRFHMSTGTITNWRGEVRASVPGFHGDAIADWGVTHFMPLPAPPTTQPTVR